MLDSIKSFFDEKTDPSLATALDKKIAAAALMVEAATMDGNIDEAELATIKDILISSFELSSGDANAILIEAAKHQKDSNHLLRFTRSIKDNFSEDERVELIEQLWMVVYTDGVLHDYEANLVRRICGLIYVSDRESGEARKRVIGELGLE